jgi:hypothetical protein
VQGQQEAVEEGQAGRRLEEGPGVRVVVGTLSALQTIVQRRGRQVVLLSEAASGATVTLLLLEKVVQELADGSAVRTRGSVTGLGGGRIAGHGSSPGLQVVG